jgi:tetratricopeptide (TPR) repeat protein
VITLLLAASFYGVWKRSPAGFLGLSIFLVLAPTSSFVPILDLAVEHRVYLPLAALVSLVVCGIFSLTQRWLHDPQARRVLQIGAVVIAVAAFGLRTAVRNVDYADPMRLWTKASQVNPRNPRPYTLMAEIALERDQLDEAIRFYEKALSVDSRDFTAHANLGNLLCQSGDTARAFPHGQQAIIIRPHRAYSYAVLGECYERQGRKEMAKKCYQAALEREPRFARAHNNLGTLAIAAGQTQAGIKHLQAAISSNPVDVIAIVNLAKVYRDQQQPSKALPLLKKAIAIDPAYAPAHLNLALLETDEGNTIDAIVSLREAMRLAPESVEARVRLAWLLATTDDAIFRNPELAVKLAEEAAQLEPMPNVETLETLAAAYAAVDRNQDAQAAIEKAIALARTENAPKNDETVNRLQRQRDAYRRNLEMPRD